ncbi:MAG: hypothetical protein Q7V53_07295 [Caldisericota bacterium]|nr:hypothetical protein [Caldisericota bacterium]
MTLVGSKTSCSNCEFLLPEAKDVADAAALAAQPCPSCGGFGRTIDVSIMETATVFDGYGMKLNRVGVKKPVVESFSKPSLSRKLGMVFKTPCSPRWFEGPSRGTIAS